MTPSVVFMRADVSGSLSERDSVTTSGSRKFPNEMLFQPKSEPSPTSMRTLKMAKPGGNAGNHESLTAPRQTNLDDKFLDQAAIYLRHAGDYPPLTSDAERKLVRKIDWIVVPMLFLTATLGAVDKVALGTAALYGLREDLKTLRPGVCLDGIDSSYRWNCWHVAVVVSRPALPTCEWPSGPEVSMAKWQFLFLIAGRIRTFNRAASAVTAAAARKGGLFPFAGSVSLARSLFAFVAIPDSPMTAFFLNDEEKYHAVHHLADNRTGIVNKHWKWDQAIEAISDPKTWLIFFFNGGNK
ncbi:hypothetical protein PAAG_06003 [Paracoccidioides lutzii Pb01]|uniref:Uncharacterized protein n=1 Tax=Paracoccidioides lutzii (strain ATCC MYA-826 / Pb01) TaxID=502779 RepID=C1H5G2_PARBA|nr:hypothetical protein PAAG_06003 [Paracoccidioides lutzii Pb01]EEH34956.2 hypothetical protein PAAG_06003 [Paracoccidioides lutzii Pb01]